MPFDNDSGTVRVSGAFSASLAIERTIRSVLAEATRDQPRAPHESLWVGGRINDLERAAIDRLLADCELVTLAIGGDQRDLVFDPSEAAASRARQGAGGEADTRQLVGFNVGHCPGLALVGGEPGNFRTPSPTVAEFEGRALDRAFARTRVERALEPLGDDRWPLLRFLVSDATDAALAAETGIPRSTMRDRLVAAISTLCRHYEREAQRRLVLPPSRRTASAAAVAEHYAHTGPSCAGGPLK